MARGKEYKNRPKEEWLSTHVNIGLNTRDNELLKQAIQLTGTNSVEAFRLALRYFVANGCPCPTRCNEPQSWPPSTRSPTCSSSTPSEVCSDSDPSPEPLMTHPTSAGTLGPRNSQ